MEIVKGRKMGKKQLRVLLLMAMVAAMIVSGAMATGGDASATTASAVESAFTAGFQDMVNSSLSVIAAIVPIAMGLAAVTFVVHKALGWFKSVAK